MNARSLTMAVALTAISISIAAGQTSGAGVTSLSPVEDPDMSKSAVQITTQDPTIPTKSPQPTPSIEPKTSIRVTEIVQQPTTPTPPIQNPTIQNSAGAGGGGQPTNSLTRPLLTQPTAIAPGNPGFTPGKIATQQVTHAIGPDGGTTLRTLFMVGGSTVSTPPVDIPITKDTESILPIGSVVSVSAGETLLFDSRTTMTLTSGQSFVISAASKAPQTTSLGSTIPNSVNKTSYGLSKGAGIGIGVAFGLLTIMLVAVLMWIKRRSQKEKQRRSSSAMTLTHRSDKNLKDTNSHPRSPVVPQPPAAEEVEHRARPYSFIPSPTGKTFPSTRQVTTIDNCATNSTSEAPPVRRSSPVSPLSPVSPVEEERIEWTPQKPVRYYAQKNGDDRKRETIPNPLNAHPVDI